MLKLCQRKNYQHCW